MHPATIGCLSAAQINCCVLVNNHVLDWGRECLLWNPGDATERRNSHTC